MISDNFQSLNSNNYLNYNSNKFDFSESLKFSKSNRLLQSVTVYESRVARFWFSYNWTIY